MYTVGHKNCATFIFFDEFGKYGQMIITVFSDELLRKLE